MIACSSIQPLLYSQPVLFALKKGACAFPGPWFSVLSSNDDVDFVDLSVGSSCG